MVRDPSKWPYVCTSSELQIGEDGETRQLITKFDVKKRVFYGNTSMEAEISLLMANQAQVSREMFEATMGARFMIIL
jgi:tRNA G10  N-methylase Trm11